MLETDTTRLRVEVCTPREKKLLGIFNFAKFFEFKNVRTSEAREYLKMFYTLSYPEQREYYTRQRYANS